MARPLLELLNPRLLRRCKALDRITQHLRGELPTEVRTHFWAAEQNGEELKVVTDNPHCIPQIHFCQSALIASFNNRFAKGTHPPIKRLRVLLTKLITGSDGLHSPKRTPAHAPTGLRDAASTIRDPELAKALMRLANRLEPT